MTLLPIVDRELRMAARSRSMYWGRAAAALSAIVFCSWFLFLSNDFRMGPQTVGKSLFVSLTWIAWIFAWFAGLLYTSDSISRERREGTLGLLFLTSLTGKDIVLGKLAATSLSAVYRVMAIVPVLGISLLLGGVAWGEFVRAVCVLFAMLFCSLSVGMLASVWSSDSPRAAGWTLLVLLGLTFGGPLLAWFGSKSFLASLSNEIAQVSIGFPIIALPDQIYGSGQHWKIDIQMLGVGIIQVNHFFLLGVVMSVGVGILSLVIAALRLPWNWREGNSFPKPSEKFVAVVAKESGLTQTQGLRAATRRSVPVPEQNVVAWLTLRHRRKRWNVWWVFGVVGLIFIIVASQSRSKFSDLAEWIFVAVSIHCSLNILVAIEASSRFGEDRRSGAMELLLTTPITEQEIIDGGGRILWEIFWVPMAVSLLLDVIVVLVGIEQIHGSDLPTFLELSFAGAIASIVSACSIAWLGMSLGMKHPWGKLTWMILLRILLVPGVLAIAMTSCLGFIAPGFGQSDFVTGLILSAIWFGTPILNGVFWWIKSRSELKRSFREMASDSRV